MTIYYVDSVSGSDAANGTSEATAWKNMTKVNGAAFGPGDRIRFKRGSGWAGTRLNLTRAGTAASPIVVEAYGSGPPPVIRDATNGQVSVQASYITVKDLLLDIDWALLSTIDAGHGPLPVQTGLYGVNITNNATNVTIKRNRILHHMAGIHGANGTSNCSIQHNHLEANGVMEQVSLSSPGGDLGAWAINIIGDAYDVGWNYMLNNVAPHQNAAGTWHSNSCEYYRSSNCVTHHNRVFGDRVFTEIGGQAGDLPDNNVWAYNLHVTGNLPNCRFFNAHGSNDQYGPCTNSTVIHNTIVFTNGNGEVGIISGTLPSPSDLKLHSNIIWSDDTTVDPNNLIDHHDNIYWSTDGTPHQSWPAGDGLGPGDRQIDPGFVNKASGDFRLSATSPAVNKGAGTGGYTKDLKNQPVPGPSSASTDQGAYERQC